MSLQCLFLSLVTVSGYTLIIGLLLLTSDVRGVQGVMYYLRRLFFSGSRLCHGMLLSILLSRFLQERTQQQIFFRGTIWLSGCSCWTGRCSVPFWIISGRKQTRLILILGGCCRRHCPYKVGPSSSTTLKKVLLTQK